MSTISRRAFLKTVGVGALSVAAVSVLAGCDSLPTGNETTVVTGTVEGKAGTLVNVDDKYTVLLKGNTASAITNGEINVPEDWYTNYKTGFETVLNKSGVGTASDAKLQEAYEAGIETANKKVKAVQFASSNELTVTINNYTDEALLIASSAATAETKAEDTKSNTKVITVTCDGKEVPCAIDTVAIAKKDDETIKCFIAFPGNCEKIEIKVAVPGASKAVVYKLTNSKYKTEKELRDYEPQS